VLAADAAAPPAPSVFQLFLKGGVVMYPLAACSVLAITLSLDRLLVLRRSRVIPRDFSSGLRAAFRHDDLDPALAYCKQHDSPIGRVVAAGLRRWRHGWPAVEKAMGDAGANEAVRLRKNMRFLYALGSVATLLGLLGTISGMIKAFQVAAAAGVGRVDQLSRGIYEAMTCTFAGLVVAVMVTVAYYFFAGRIERLVVEMNEELTRFADAHVLDGATATAPRLPAHAAA
jgi:biopolymer transport protein ExbB